MSQGELLARMIRGLDKAEIPHMVVGSLASSFHAEPRTTLDIDIVIDPTPESLKRFVEDLPRPELYADADAATDALARRTSFNIIEAHTGWKVDLLIRRDRQFSREELERRIPVRLLGADTHVATAEDTIIAKLEWAKQGESDRQLRDVAAILSMNRDTLDHVYLDRWITSLGLTYTWERAKGLITDT
ncbi:MAG: hypothetical protein H0W10_08790 [Chloroflexi bacterium]|nr:hypothetical protein [Chloroflexota bacterium]